MSEVTPVLQTFQRLGKDYEKDEDTQKILEDIKDHPEYKILENRIYLMFDGRMRLYIPKGELKNSVICYLHDARYAGHLGIKRIVDLVKKDFY